MEEKGEIRLFEQVFSRKYLFFYILQIRFERCVLQKRWKMVLGFPKKSPCACSGLAVDCPSMWSASGGQ